MKNKHIFLSLLSATFGLLAVSCGGDGSEEVTAPKPTVEIAVGEITSTGCAVTYTLGDQTVCYRTVNIPATEFARLSSAELTAQIEAMPYAYVTSKLICKLLDADEYVIAAIPYAADGTAGELVTASYTLGEFAFSGKLYVEASESYPQRTVHNTLYVSLYTSGRAKAGRYIVATADYVTLYRQNYGAATYLTKLLDDYGKVLTEQQLEDIDNRTAESESMAFVSGLTDGVEFALVVELTDYNDQVHYATYNGATEEIILLPAYKRFIGLYTQQAVTLMTDKNDLSFVMTYPIKDIEVEVTIGVKNESFIIAGLSQVLASFEPISFDLYGAIGTTQLTLMDEIEGTFNETTGAMELHSQSMQATFTPKTGPNSNLSQCPVKFLLTENGHGQFNPPYQTNYFLNGVYDDATGKISFGGYGTDAKYDGYTFAYDLHNGTGSTTTDFTKVSDYIAPRQITWTKTSSPFDAAPKNAPQTFALDFTKQY